MAAFAVLAPGTVLLDLVEDSRETETPQDAGARRLRYSDAAVCVEVTVLAAPSGFEVTVAEPVGASFTIELTQLAPSLQLSRTGSAPVRFEPVREGLFRLLVRPSDGQHPGWCTSWTRP